MSLSPRSPKGRPPFNRSGFAAALLAGTMLAGGGFAWSHHASAATESQQATGQAPIAAPAVGNLPSFAPLVNKVKAAVVNISTEAVEKPDPNQQQAMPDFPPDSPFGQMFRHYFDQQRRGQKEHALASGFIIDPSGYIVTNNHVVDGATKITVKIDGGDSYTAKVIGTDEKTDLALIKIDAGHPLPYVAWGNSDQAQVGDWVIAVGNPFGLGGTVTAGIVSAHDRNINAGPYDDFLQIDAPINPGNSGGPLFNQSGQVVGIDSAIYSPNGGSVGIGFAIPSNLASKVVDQLRSHGSVARGWLGVQMQPVNDQMAKAVGLAHDQGVLVDQVMDDSPAKKADIQQGDVITAYNDTQIKTTRDLAAAVADAHAGDTAHLTLWRDGHDQKVDVTIAALPKDQQVASADDSKEGSVGMSLAPLDKDARDQLNLNSNAHGVVVANVTPGSHADESGVQAGDVIVRVGNQQVDSPSDAASKIKAAQQAKRAAVPLLVTRNGTTYYLALQLANG